MEESSKRKAYFPQEIEEGIKSIKTVSCNPFSVLPKEIYLEIFDKLENAVDKQNFMNAHGKFYDLFKSRRILFLFQQVFKEVARKNEDGGMDYSLEEEDDKRLFEDYKNWRLVCRDWNKGIGNFFQYHDSHFMLKGGEEHLSTVCQFGIDYDSGKMVTFFSSMTTDRDLEMFSLTHPPSKNPFLARSITLLPFFNRIVYDVEAIIDIRGRRRAVTSLLERYGRHIWHCDIEIDHWLDVGVCICIAKWISLMPELKTLHLDCDQYARMDLHALEYTQLIQPELKNLIVLKSTNLPAIAFNKLFGNMPNLRKLQLMILKGPESFLRNFDFKIERKNLHEAFLTLKGVDDMLFLQSSEAFPSLKKLAIALEFETYSEREDKVYRTWPEWKMIFEILEEKFPALEELTLRLPGAASMKSKKAVIDQSLNCRLNLPNLKKFWVALPNTCSLDFLLTCKALEVCEVFIEHCAWEGQSMDWKIGSREKITFNVDFSKMWESNIWELFPKLRKLNIRAWRYFPSRVNPDCIPFDEYAYDKSGGKKNYRGKILPFEEILEGIFGSQEV